MVNFLKTNLVLAILYTFCLYSPRLPKHVSLEEGALMEPLAVAVYSCQRGQVSTGSNVLVLGAGELGFLPLGNFACLLLSADFFSKSSLKKFFQKYHQCQTVWNEIRPDIMSGLIWFQTVCKVINRRH